MQSKEYALLGNSGYMLLEFDPGSRSRYMLDFVRSILDMTAASDAKAKHVVLAHVERYSNLANDDEALNTLLAWGCRIQINAYSLAEEQKPSMKAAGCLMRGRYPFLAQMHTARIIVRRV